MSAQAWQRVRIAVDREDLRWVCDRLQELEPTGLEERPLGEVPPPRQPWDEGPPPPPPERVELIAYFDLNAQSTARLTALSTALNERPHLAFEADVIREGDWEELWRERFVPQEIAPGLTVAPPWNAPQGAIIIEPAMAFGTGDHPSTRECLKAVARYAQPEGALLDVGTGSGILAITGTHFGMRAEGIDTDPQAVEAAYENAARNDASCEFSTTPLHRIQGTFDLVTANLFAEVLVKLAPELIRVTEKRLICAGILSAKAHMVIEALSPLQLDETIDDGEWVCLHWSRV